MQEMVVDRKNLEDEQGKQREYIYSVVIGERRLGGFSCEDYGVKIAETGGAEAMAPDLTTSVSRIDELMDLLTRNTVTPVTLADVVSDWLDR